MQYQYLASTPLRISRICLGCMSFGTPGKGIHKWSLAEEDSRPIIGRAIELGVNFFDTANVYGHGRSEEIVGRALKDMARREDLVVATKVGLPMGDDPESRGLSRRSILKAIDESLTRLGMDYIDLYIMHRPDWSTPIEETLETFDELVTAGKVRYLGASSMLAWQFARMIDMQRANGWAQFVSMQNYYNLLYREEEREMIPLCKQEGISVTPWSPLARGKLARTAEQQTERTRSDLFGSRLLNPVDELDRPILDTLHRLADSSATAPGRLALAWLLQKDMVASPVVGVTSLSQLEDACAAPDITLAPDQIAMLEEPYRAHPMAEMTLNVLQPGLGQR